MLGVRCDIFLWYLLDLEMFAGSNEAFGDENEEDDDDNE